MCGIVGYIGERDAVEVVMAGLHRLEYRGYDSAGLAVIEDGRLDCVKSLGKLSALDERLAAAPLHGKLAIGHTRWATHGAPSEANSHPHLDAQLEIAVVHNGIIENFPQLRTQLEAEGVTFRSQTDTEVLAHLIRKHYRGDLFEAVKEALKDVEGAYAIAVVCREHPGMLVAARHGSPLVVGLGEGEAFVASDVPAIIRFTRKVLFLDNGQVCALRRDGYVLEDINHVPQEVEVAHIEWDEVAAEKDGYPHFMLKEIHQQPDVLRNTLRGRVQAGSDEILLPDMQLTEDELKACQRILIVACGTAWHAGLVGKYLIEKFAKVPVEVDVASEFRYRDPIIAPNTLMIPVSQSGETADTLEAIRIAKSRGAKVAAIVNVVGSSVARESHGVIYQQAGPEIGVASTKAYTSQLTCLALFALWLARARGALQADQIHELVGHLRQLPEKLQWCLDHQDGITRIARNPKYLNATDAIFLGRGFNYPSALEGALKLKEISYIHAEGYAAGEMKHGPIALVTDVMPVICIAPRSAFHEKMVSNIQEVRARDGLVLAVATEGDDEIAQYCQDVIRIPDCYEPFSPIIAAVPLQLLAYRIATNRGCDVDQPRNLAKSVTVE